MLPLCLCMFRCGTTRLPRQPKTGPTPACGSTGRLTSSGSWVKTSLLGQAGKWPLTLSRLTSAALLPSVSSHGRWLCSSLLHLLSEPSYFFFFTRWPSDCLRNAPVTLQINKSCVLSHDPWGQRCIPLVGLYWLSVWKSEALSCVLHF